MISFIQVCRVRQNWKLSQHGSRNPRCAPRCLAGTMIDGSKRQPAVLRLRSQRGVVTTRTLSVTVVRWGQTRKIVPPNWVTSIRLRSSAQRDWSWEIGEVHHSHESWLLRGIVVYQKCGAWSSSVPRLLAQGLLKTRATELKRFSKGLEPDRRTVWPCDTTVLPRCVCTYDSDSKKKVHNPTS